MAGLDLDFFLATLLCSLVNLYVIKGLTKIESSACLELSLSVLELVSIQSKEKRSPWFCTVLFDPLKLIIIKDTL